jgi:hypothetical protein
MSAGLALPTAAPSPAAPARVEPLHTHGRPKIARLLIAALVLLGAAVPVKWWVGVRRSAVMPREPEFSAELTYKLPALMLTGLRGPLTTALWLAAEQGKQDREWELLQTYYNAIGALQPHFVQNYQMNGWNSAYNMSVQWNNLDRKYEWIKKGIVLVHEGDRRNPDHIDLVSYLSDLYGDKLGRSFEKMFYSMRFREETRTLSPGDPEYLTRQAVIDRFNALNPAEPDTFPYGVAPLGYGWYFSERGYVLQRDGGQKHHQFGPQVVSSRVPHFLRDWAYHEHELARLRAKECFDDRPFELSEEYNFFPLLSAEQRNRLMRRPRAEVIREAMYRYQSAARIFNRAIAEYQRHIVSSTTAQEFEKGVFVDDELYRRQIQTCWYDRQIILGSYRTFQALLITAGRVGGGLEDAAAHFAAAEEHFRNALGDPRKWDPNRIDEWRLRPEIGMTLYTDANLPISEEAKSRLRQDLLDAIRYYRQVVGIIYDCRQATRLYRGARMDGVFTKTTNERLIRWVILRDPPKPFGQ